MSENCFLVYRMNDYDAWIGVYELTLNFI